MDICQYSQIEVVDKHGRRWDGTFDYARLSANLPPGLRSFSVITENGYPLLGRVIPGDDHRTILSAIGWVARHPRAIS